MKRCKIVFLDEYSVSDCDLSSIRSLGDYIGYYDTTPETVEERCQGAEIVLTNKVVIDGALMRRLPELRLICVVATGMNNVDLETAGKLGILVRNAAGYSTHSVAETALGSAIALMRQTLYYDSYVKSGAYSASSHLFNFDRPTRQICGCNWGIIGLGNIGRETARLAEALGCRVAYASTSGIQREESWPRMHLDDLLAWADIVSVHCPLNAATRGLIGTRELLLMKQTAVLINVARGGIVNEVALAAALDEHQIAGAALDVFEHEPLNAQSPLLHLRESDRLLLSPHNAWSADVSLQNLVRCVTDNIRTYIDSQKR